MKIVLLLLTAAMLPLFLTACTSDNSEERQERRETRHDHRKNRQEQRIKAFEPLRPDEEFRVFAK